MRTKYLVVTADMVPYGITYNEKKKTVVVGGVMKCMHAMSDLIENHFGVDVDRVTFTKSSRNRIRAEFKIRCRKTFEDVMEVYLKDCLKSGSRYSKVRTFNRLMR